MAETVERKCLIVLGMHRSGTSALTGALSLAGLYPGRVLYRPTEFNAKGNFENIRITRLNDKILAVLDATWDDTLQIEKEWWKLEKIDVFRQEIITIILEELNENNSILIKDPRLSILLPLYLELLTRLDIKPAFVICVRNPLECAASLERRNSLPLEKSLLLWMDYELKAEYYSRNYTRIFLYYHHLLDDPGKVLLIIKEKLRQDITVNPETIKAVASFLDRELKHHNLGDLLPDVPYLPHLKETYNLLHAASLRDLTGLESAALDEIQANFRGVISLGS